MILLLWHYEKFFRPTLECPIRESLVLQKSQLKNVKKTLIKQEAHDQVVNDMWSREN